MKAKLIKKGSFGYKIKFYNDDDTAACALGLLSLKNCQAIENGYDLDELADKYYGPGDYGLEIKTGFIKGFEVAMRLMGDKKFSEEDVKRAFNKGAFYGSTGLGNTHYFDGILESLQQTEWDVEVEMICPHPMDTYRCGLQYGCDGDGCNHPNQIPYLDANGCLILKRV